MWITAIWWVFFFFQPTYLTWRKWRHCISMLNGKMPANNPCNLSFSQVGIFHLQRRYIGPSFAKDYFINNFTTTVFKILGDDMWKKEPLTTWGLSMLWFQVWWDHIGINFGSILWLVGLQSESARNIYILSIIHFRQE